MPVTSMEKAEITARSGVLRSATGRSGAVGDAQQIYTADAAPNHYGGEFKYTESPTGDTPESDSTTYTSVAV